MKKLILLLLLIPLIPMVAACGDEFGVCGWSDLMDGNLVRASFNMFNIAWAGWVVTILFFVYQFMLILKTRNLVLSFTTGAFFAAVFGSSLIVDSFGDPLLKPVAFGIMITLLVVQFAAIVFLWFWK